MWEIQTERRQQTDRRFSNAGGRRMTDLRDRRLDRPACPTCGERDSALAGESDGGWWFVCLACDHLWNQRVKVICGSFRLQPTQ